ncbi:hypothetical protein BZA77DRAFT_353658 [Pyronema omphalodes]|nr:hypothetical protein BZA77DRAFT_353658 [Pyronema omphalodes]
MQLSFNLLAFTLLVSSITAIPIATEVDPVLVSVIDTPAELPITTDSQLNTIDEPFLPDFKGTLLNAINTNRPKQRDREVNRRLKDDGIWYEGKYEGYGTPYDDGKWYPGKYEETDLEDDGLWYPIKHEGYPSTHDNGIWYPGKYNKREAEVEAKWYPQDDGKWYQGKYEGHGTPYDDGKWYPGKYEETDLEGDGLWYPLEEEEEANRCPQDDGKWYQGKYEGYRTGYDMEKYHG